MKPQAKILLKRLQKIEGTIKILNAEKSSIYRIAKVEGVSIEKLKARLYGKDNSDV